ncbi:hypothetical protein [Auritidibacter ignavus]|uniref:hypothetical protein n=1 Tax=Auritidibacter ignavus TaxID=678932 RepID=UPI002447F86D|nr:hypothetical protein [Auritidibacter ignavus]WGH83045.1 hypothetical protein QDX20_07065 [Auritidibacter ignavus]
MQEEKSESTQQSIGLFILAGIHVVVLIGLQLSGALSDMMLSAVAWFVGMMVATWCVLKAVIPLLSSTER